MKKIISFFSFILLTGTVILSCEKEPTESLTLLKHGTNNLIKWANINEFPNVKSYALELSKSKKNQLNRNNQENEVYFTILDDIEAYVFLDSLVTTYTIPIQKVNQTEYGFSNLVIKYNNENQEEEFILNYIPTQEYLNSYVDYRQTPFEGTVEYESLYNNSETNRMASRFCSSVSNTYCCWSWGNDCGDTHDAGPNCTPEFMWTETTVVCEDDPTTVFIDAGPSGGGGGGGTPTTPIPSDTCENQRGNIGISTNDGCIVSPLDIEINNLISIIEQPLFAETAASYRERLSAVGEYFTLASHPDFVGLDEMLTDAINDPGLSIDDLGLMWQKTKEAYDILKPYVLELAGLDSLDDMSVVVPPLELATAERNLTEVAFLPQVKSLLANWPQTVEQWTALGEILFQPQFLLEIGVAFIPGSSIIDVVSGLDEGDYLAVTFGIAGLVLDAFGGTIIKAIGKIGKVAYKSFKIFKIVFRYLDEVAEIITLGYKADLVNGIVKISNDIGTAIAEIQDNVIRFLTNGAKSLIKVADLKFLDNVLPSPSGNIGKTVIDEKALKIKPDNSDYADDIADIIQNGDPSGNKTEDLIQDLLNQDGYNPPNFDVHLPSNQGFDNVLIKRDNSGNITDVIINESKQVGSTGNISLSGGVGCPGGPCTQMTSDWINYTLDRMRQQGGNLEDLADEIDDFSGTITQIVSGVNKQTGELVIVNITGF